MSPDDWKVHILPSIIVAGSVAAVAVAVLAVARSGEEVAAAITETNDTLRAPAAVFIKTAPEMTRSLSKIAGTLGRLKKAGIKGKIGWFPVSLRIASDPVVASCTDSASVSNRK